MGNLPVGQAKIAAINQPNENAKPAIAKRQRWVSLNGFYTNAH